MIDRRLVVSALLSLAACGSGPDAPAGSASLSVAATAIPHAEILEHIKPMLAKQGIVLKVVVLNDFVQPNIQVAEGRVDVNYFQTKPYLDEFNANRSPQLVTIAGVHVEPLGGYSRKWKTVGEIPSGATVAIPNEGSNGGRALALLAKAGLITLRPAAGALATPRDILANPRNLQIKELEAATLPRVLDQVDLALINTNYALVAGLNPVRDALVIEDKNSPYVNYVVGLESAKADPRMAKLVAALRSDDVKAFIAKNYAGAVIPAF
jgi:D-methionine transport system substrate-binding protein